MSHSSSRCFFIPSESVGIGNAICDNNNMIYHICLKTDWEKEKENKCFGETEIQKYGFIHSSTKEGLQKIIKRFENTDEYIVLVIDEKPIEEIIRYEEKDANHLYPHFYELIDMKAIKETCSLNDFLSGYEVN